MMFIHSPNGFMIIATILSAVAASILAVFWYHPRVLGARWAEARGGMTITARPRPETLIYTFMLWLLAAAFYSFMVNILHADSVQSYIGLSCLLWVAFAMPPTVMGSLYTGYSFKAVAIDAAYQLAGYYLFALVHITLKVSMGQLH